jgi:hypothetical protein
MEISNADTVAKLIEAHETNIFRLRGPATDQELLAMWFRLSKPGAPLPDNDGLIVLDGDRP